jgi:hypothetical protein
MHKILEGENEAEAAGNEQDGADEVGHFFCGTVGHDVQREDEGQLEKCQDGVGQPENPKPVILMIAGGDSDLSDGGNFGDQIGLIPAQEKLRQHEDKQATIWV